MTALQSAKLAAASSLTPSISGAALAGCVVVIGPGVLGCELLLRTNALCLNALEALLLAAGAPVRHTLDVWCRAAIPPLAESAHFFLVYLRSDSERRWGCRSRRSPASRACWSRWAQASTALACFSFGSHKRPSVVMSADQLPAQELTIAVTERDTARTACAAKVPHNLIKCLCTSRNFQTAVYEALHVSCARLYGVTFVRVRESVPFSIHTALLLRRRRRLLCSALSWSACTTRTRCWCAHLSFRAFEQVHDCIYAPATALSRGSRRRSPQQSCRYQARPRKRSLHAC